MRETYISINLFFRKECSDSIKSNQTIEIEGQFYFDNDKLYITPFVIWDEYGENLIEDFEKSKEEDEVLNKDYILPQSASYLLTESRY